MLLIRGTHLNNRLAPKIQNFSTNLSQAGVLVDVKTDKSEHSSLTSNIIFNKTCEVSLDTILFIERMNKIEDDRSTLYKVVFSRDSLLVAYGQIKSKPGNVTSGQGKETPQGINLRWFRTISKKLFKGLFVYKKMRRVVYVRYADDFVLGITGPRDFALKIATKIETFIKSGVRLKVNDVSLISRDKEVIKFLGLMYIYRQLRIKLELNLIKLKVLLNIKIGLQLA